MADTDDTPAMADPASMDGSSPSVSARVPRKFTAITLSGLPAPEEMPATLNRAWTGPPMAETAASTEAGSERSRVWNSFTSTAGSCRSRPTTWAPRSTSARAVSAPMPDAQPVTTTRRPS